jgi:hypothetical protein
VNDTLLVALVASGSALLGAAIGQISPLILHWLDARRLRRMFFRERFEELAQVSADLAVQVARLPLEPTSHYEIARELTRLTGRAAVLTTVYFSPLAEARMALNVATHRLTEDIRHGVLGIQMIDHISEFHSCWSDFANSIRAHRGKYT